MTPRISTALLAAAAVVAALVTAVAPAQGRAQTTECDGKPATIVGPTSGTNTVGTEGDDVIVAPIASFGTISGGNGNDAICLVGVSTIPPADDFYGFTVVAGDGNDTVLNQTTETAPNGHVTVLLGAGTDRFVGADYAESVYGALSAGGSVADTEVDVIDSRGGNDGIGSGTDTPGFANNDVISTGAGRDYITYGGLAGGAIDNGPDADTLLLVNRWAGNLALDNMTRRATLDGKPALTWTSIDSFSFRVTPGSGVSFAGNETAETLDISGNFLDVTAPAATITMGGGDDALELENYLPASADMGAGEDSLDWTGCRTATITLGRGVDCLTEYRADVVVGMAGVEALRAEAVTDLTVVGTPGADDIDAESRGDVTVRVGAGRDVVGARGRGDVFVSAGSGADEVKAGGHLKVTGGTGADRLIGWSPRKSGVTLRGGRGGDFLRGNWGADRLYGGLGQDAAYGQKNDDLCKAEVRHGCEQR